MKRKTTEDLIDKAIRGNKNAQRQLYDAYASNMLALCMRYLKNREDAYDVFQEGFIKVFKNLHQLKNRETLVWWMKKIFVNEALQLIKKRKQVDSTDISKYSLHLHSKGEESAVLSKMAVDDITKLIKQLPEGMQMIVNLFIIEGFSHKEISVMLGISEGTSKSQLHDARLLLKSKIMAYNMK